MKYRLEFIGIRDGATDPEIIVVVLENLDAAIKRFLELEEAALTPETFITWKLCMNQERHIRWKHPIRYNQHPKTEKVR